MLKNEQRGPPTEKSKTSSLSLFSQKRFYMELIGSRTLVKSSTLLVSQLPSLFSSRVEKFSVRKFDENGEKQRMGMISVLEMLREKSKPLLPLPHMKSLQVVGIDHGEHLQHSD
jgi:hypothetical protein